METRLNTRKTLFPILFGFFVMGFVDVTGIATNHVKADFQLSDTMANLLPMMVFLWFALFSIPAGIRMSKRGRRSTVLLSLFITAIAMFVPLLFYDFLCLLAAFALLGIGNTILQVSLNPMVAYVVEPGKMTSVLTLGQFIKAISSFLGPVIAGAAASFFGNWRLIFAVYAVTSLLAALWLVLTVPDKEKLPEAQATFVSTLSLFKDNYVTAMFFAILFIVGIDVGLNTTIPKLLMEKTGMTLNQAGLGISLYFAARTIGSFAGAFILARCAAGRFLRVTMAVAIPAFLILLIATAQWLLFVMIAIIGLMCSNVFSIIFSSALRHKPAKGNELSALMIMGVSGGALIPPLMGIAADCLGQVAGLSVLLVCLVYLYLVSFKIN